MNANQGGYTVRPMLESDLDAVLAIEVSSFPRPWSREHFRYELSSPHAFSLVAVSADEAVAGYICASLLFDEAEILDVAVRCDRRGEGVGRMLVERVLAHCRYSGIRLLHLEVRRSNSAAITLYERLCFTTTGERRRYYENGEDAILMQHNFTSGGERDAV